MTAGLPARLPRTAGGIGLRPRCISPGSKKTRAALRDRCVDLAIRPVAARRACRPWRSQDVAFVRVEDGTPRWPGCTRITRPSPQCRPQRRPRPGNAEICGRVVAAVGQRARRGVPVRSINTPSDVPSTTRRGGDHPERGPDAHPTVAANRASRNRVRRGRIHTHRDQRRRASSRRRQRDWGSRSFTRRVKTLFPAATTLRESADEGRRICQCQDRSHGLRAAPAACPETTGPGATSGPDINPVVATRRVHLGEHVVKLAGAPGLISFFSSVVASDRADEAST